MKPLAFASVLVLLFGCQKTPPQKAEDKAAFRLPAATEVFNLGSRCPELANQMLNDSARFSHALNHNTVSHYDPKTNLGTAFASDVTCHGTVLINYTGLPQNSSSLDNKNVDYQLMLNFTLGEASHNWSMVRRKTNGENWYTTGNGNPREIAHTICAVISQSGGTTY